MYDVQCLRISVPFKLSFRACYNWESVLKHCKFPSSKALWVVGSVFIYHFSVIFGFHVASGGRWGNILIVYVCLTQKMFLQTSWTFSNLLMSRLRKGASAYTQRSRWGLLYQSPKKEKHDELSIWKCAWGKPAYSGLGYCCVDLGWRTYRAIQ